MKTKTYLYSVKQKLNKSCRSAERIFNSDKTHRTTHGQLIASIVHENSSRRENRASERCDKNTNISSLQHHPPQASKQIKAPGSELPLP